MMTVDRSDNPIDDNSGFSLVELIICVAILAIATIPLMSAFSTSGIVIGKAQSVQNATSVAESVMEEIKGSSIEMLKNTTGYKYVEVSAADYDYSGFMGKSDAAKLSYCSALAGSNKGLLAQQKDKQFYVFYKHNVKPDAPAESGNGELFDVVATIDASVSYNTDSKKTDASDANSLELPVIERIDRVKHAVISKEINRLDASAAETWKNNYADRHPSESFSSIVVPDLTKDVIVTINEVSDTQTDVECYVRYHDSDKSFDPDTFGDGDACHIVEKVYSGSFADAEDARVYLFYQTAKQNIHYKNQKNGLGADEDKIVQEDVYITNTYAAGSEHKTRQVFLILQEDEKYSTGDDDYYKLDYGNTHMSINLKGGAGSVKVSQNSDDKLKDDGVIESGTLKVVTNLEKVTGGSHFYYNEKDDYIYQIEVQVFDSKGREKAHLKSTKNAERTPTPTPAPPS